MGKKSLRIETNKVDEQQNQIAHIAYSLWEQRGRPEGSPDVDWFVAEAHLHENGATVKRGNGTSANRDRAISPR